MALRDVLLHVPNGWQGVCPLGTFVLFSAAVQWVTAAQISPSSAMTRNKVARAELHVGRRHARRM
jgi:hypothetical protein